MRRSASLDTAGTRLTTTPHRSRSGLSPSHTPSTASATLPMPRSPSADGSTTIRAWRATVSAVSVAPPSVGGQSTRIAS